MRFVLKSGNLFNPVFKPTTIIPIYRDHIKEKSLNTDWNSQSINQSKFIFQVITEKLQYNNVVALERLPEKHYAH